VPSPIAHSSLVLLAAPLLRGRAWETLTRKQRLILYGAIVFALCAPDLDFVAILLFGESEVIDHGGFSHSLVAGVIFAFLLAIGCRPLVKLEPWRLFVICCACYWVHLLMDVMTRGGGVMLLWPFSHERFAAPIPLFYGAQHSQPLAWKLHLITLANDLGFAAVIWIVAYLLKRARHRSSSTAAGTRDAGTPT